MSQPPHDSLPRREALQWRACPLDEPMATLEHILETGNDSYRFKASSETAKKKRKETPALTPS